MAFDGHCTKSCPRMSRTFPYMGPTLEETTRSVKNNPGVVGAPYNLNSKELLLKDFLSEELLQGAGLLLDKDTSEHGGTNNYTKTSPATQRHLLLYKDTSYYTNVPPLIQTGWLISSFRKKRLAIVRPSGGLQAIMTWLKHRKFQEEAYCHVKDAVALQGFSNEPLVFFEIANRQFVFT